MKYMGLLSLIISLDLFGEIQLELVKEWKFDKPIKEVVWGEVENGRIYPRIVVFKDEIRFYNKRGETVQSIWLGDEGRRRVAAISRWGKYIGIWDIVRYATKANDGRCVLFIYDREGNKVCELNYSIGYNESPPKIYISDDGYFVEAYPREHILVFRNVDGSKIRKIDIFKNDKANPFRMIFCAFIENGKYLAVLGAKDYNVKDTTCDTINYVILFNQKGTEIWRTSIDVNYATDIKSSYSGEYFLVKGGMAAGRLGILKGVFYLFNKNGLVKKYTFPTDRKGTWHPVYAFSKKGNRLVIAQNNQILLVDTESGKVLFKEILWKGGKTRVSEVALTSYGELIGIGYSLSPGKVGVMVLNDAGKKLYQTKVNLSGKDKNVKMVMRTQRLILYRESQQSLKEYILTRR